MQQVLVIHLGREDGQEVVTFLGQRVEILRRGCGGDPDRARALIAEFDGRVAAIGLEGLPAELHLGQATRAHAVGVTLPAIAQETPVVDGDGVRAGLERWGVILADRAQPGIFAHKRVLMTPGLNHNGLAHALQRRGCTLHYADPLIYFNLPALPGVGSKRTLEQAAPATLEQLADAPFRRYAPDRLAHKTVVVESATEEDLADLRRRGAAIAVTMMPSLEGETGSGLGRWPAATIEALLVALRPNPSAPLSEDTYLDMLAEIRWTPAIHYLQPEERAVNRFAFVIHPLDVGFIHRHPIFRWTRYLPDELVERISAHMPPIFVSKITGGVSAATGQRIEGYLISLGATPRQMMQRDERFTYQKLNQAAHLAERLGARIMGLGAFTSVVGDAGVTVAHEADIAITSGNSLTVAATLEAAKQAVIKMGATDLTRGRVMVVGATGSIASVCARLLAQAIHDVVLVSIEPEKLLELKRTIQAETPGAKVTIATRAGDLVADCDLIVTATSAFGQRVVDVTRCKPGAVICDVARPLDIGEAEAALRPDILIIESGEVIIPGDVDLGYNIGLPPKTSYACLGETALLAMDGRFEDYTLGRAIEMERVKEIFRLFKKHGFQLAGLRSFGRYITDEDVAQKRALAEQLRADPAYLAQVKAEAAAKLAGMPAMSKGVKAGNGRGKLWVGIIAGMGMATLLLQRVGAGKKKSSAEKAGVQP